MTEMIERVARAMMDACEHRGAEDPINWDYVARAAFDAMRVPTRPMLLAGDSVDDPHNAACAETHWRAMIDAALAQS